MTGELLRADNIIVTLGGKRVLDDVSLTLDAGELVSLIGPNGAGKTTLLRTLLGRKTGPGNITLFGEPAENWSSRVLAKKIAYMPQSPTYEPDDRVVDLLRLGRAPHGGILSLDSVTDDAVVEKVAADLQLGELLSREVGTLSGGQRQRVFLGRCMAQQPNVLLLDEPANFLDLKHQVDLYRLLKKFTEEDGLGVLMASHDLNLTAAYADRLILIKDGRVLATGSSDAVLTPTLLYEAYGIAIEVLRRPDGVPVLVPKV